MCPYVRDSEEADAQRQKGPWGARDSASTPPCLLTVTFISHPSRGPSEDAHGFTSQSPGRL